MARPPSRPVELDARLARLGRDWFAEARRRSAEDDEEVRRFARQRAARRPDSGGSGDTADESTSDCGDD